MTNGKLFELRPISQLFATVKDDLPKLDDEGLIDEGKLIKVIMYCNDKLGIGVREVKQCVIPVEDYKANLPKNFEKLHYVCALHTSNTGVVEWRNPFDNSFDRDIIYDANVSRDKLGGANHYSVTINKITNATIQPYSSWVELQVTPQSFGYCHESCPNTRRKAKHQVTINDDYTLSTPFKKGELYIMYLATMENEEGDLLFPFNPIITPYYEWSLKERILINAIMNSEGDYVNMLKLAQQEKRGAWLDAFNMTYQKSYNEWVAKQKERELNFYNHWFSYFK